MIFSVPFLGLVLAVSAHAAAPEDSAGLYAGFKRSLGAKSPHGYKVVSAPEPLREGKTSERFELRSGDCTGNKSWNDCATDRERSELAQLPPLSAPGQEYWYAFSLFLPREYENVFPVKVSLGQFHQEGASHPPAMFQNSKEGYWIELNQTRQKPALLIEEKNLRGRWHDLLVSARWSKEKNGYVKIWVDGELKFSHEGANLTQAGRIFFKYGIYRSFLSRTKKKIPDQVVYFDAVRWGKSKEQVEVAKP